MQLNMLLLLSLHSVPERCLLISSVWRCRDYILSNLEMKKTAVYVKMGLGLLLGPILKFVVTLPFHGTVTLL